MRISTGSKVHVEEPKPVEPKPEEVLTPAPNPKLQPQRIAEALVSYEIVRLERGELKKTSARMISEHYGILEVFGYYVYPRRKQRVSVAMQTLRNVLKMYADDGSLVARQSKVSGRGHETTYVLPK